MHLYVLARGIKPNLDKFVNDLLAQYLPYRFGPEKGMVGQIQLGVRPIELLEIAFPKESLDQVLEMVWPYDETGGIHKYVSFIRKLIPGLKDIPPRPKKAKFTPRVYRKSVSVLGLGIKEDENLNIEAI